MFYHCARYHFEFPGAEEPGVGGGIVASSGIPKMSMVRRQRRLGKQYPWLAHRLFDAQLYLANLPATAKHTANLATYPWFGVSTPAYDSQQHKVVAAWMKEHDQKLRDGWERKVLHPTNVATSSIDFQLNFGAEYIILAAPLVTTIATQFSPALEYIDAGIYYAKLRNVRTPLVATVAITDSVLRGIPPEDNSLLRSISDQIAARDELAGAYIVIEQSADSGHYYNCEEGCLSLLLLVDDLCRGARKQVIVNYAGGFGAVCAAVGARIWASGHYRSQRRLKLADEEDDGGSAFPRYFSAPLFGDIGLKENVDLAFRSRLRNWLFNPATTAAKPLIKALSDGKKVADVLEWAYLQGNLAEAAKHYYETCVLADAFLTEMTSSMRIRAIDHWLNTATRLADQLAALPGFQQGSHTDVQHQQVWLNAFRKWRTWSNL